MESSEGFVLIGGDDRSEVLASCEVYNRDFEIPPLPLPLIGLIAEVVQATGSIVVAGGYTGDGKASDKTFLLPSRSSKTWKEMGRMPHPVVFAASVTIGDDVLVLGGDSGSGAGTEQIQVLSLRDTNPTWYVVTNKRLPRPLCRHQCVVWKDSVLILTELGVMYSIPVNKLITTIPNNYRTSESLHPTDWVESELPGVKGSDALKARDWVKSENPGVEGRVGGTSMEVIEEVLVAVRRGQVWRQHAIGGEWENLPSLPEEKWYPSIVSRDNRLVIAGGQVDGAASSAVYELDGSTNSWKAAPPLKQPRGLHATVEIPPGLRSIKILLEKLKALSTTDALNKLKVYVEQKNLESKVYMEEIIDQQTGRLEGRLSRIIVEASFITKTPLHQNVKKLLEIPEYVIGDPVKEISLETFLGHLEDVLVSSKCEGLEAKLYTSGLQGCGKTSMVRSLVEQKPHLSETTEEECTQLMKEHNFNLERRNDFTIEVVPENNGKLNILKVVPKLKVEPKQGDNAEQKEMAEVTDARPVNIKALDMGGHDEYVMATKILFTGKSAFLLIFDGAKYSKDTYYRHVGGILDNILDQCPKAAIALVANKCDKGKKHFSDKEKLINTVKNHINHRIRNGGVTPYLFDEVFEIACFERSQLPLFKDATLCYTNIMGEDDSRKDEGIEYLRSCIAELYLDTALDGGQSIIPLEREYPSMWNKFHKELKDRSKNAENGPKPLTYQEAEDVFKTFQEKFNTDNKSIIEKDENEEINWFIKTMEKNGVQEVVPNDTQQNLNSSRLYSSVSELSSAVSIVEKKEVEDNENAADIEEKISHSEDIGAAVK